MAKPLVSFAQRPLTTKVTEPMSGKLLASAVIASLGGFLFGFDTVVISGAEQSIQALWGLSDWTHGMAMSAALWGTVLGALAGAVPTDRLGRKGTLLWIGLLYLASAVWSALATDVASFWVARFLGGVGVGVSTVVAPLYISEIAPPRQRGWLAGLFQFNIVLGILIAFVSNSALRGLENDWRWMLGAEGFPALAYTAFALFIPESPRWLIGLRGRTEEGREVIRQLNPQADRTTIDALVDDIARAAAEEERLTGGAPFSIKLKTPIVLALLIAFFNQLSGINAVLYFAPRIFEMTGLGARSAFLQTIGIGVTNLVFTFVGLALIDRLGRKTLLTIGSLGYIASLGLCSYAFFTETFGIVPACIFAFIASHAIGQGAVIWVYISEIFPNEHRAIGNSIGCGAHWVFAALITMLFPVAVGVEALTPGHIFAFFCFMMVLQLVWVLTMVVETKGVPLEEIQNKLGIS